MTWGGTEVSGGGGGIEGVPMPKPEAPPETKKVMSSLEGTDSGSTESRGTTRTCPATLYAWGQYTATW